MMDIKNCKKNLKERIMNLNRRINEKRKEYAQIPKELSWEERLKAREPIDEAIRDAEVFVKQLQMLLKILRDDANTGDKAEIVDKGDVIKRTNEFDYAEDSYVNEAFVSAHRCINFELNEDALEDVVIPDDLLADNELFEGYHQYIQMEEDQRVRSKFKEQVVWVIGLASIEAL